MQKNSRYASRRHPIFVLGMLQRSGTNYLNNLLLLHPDLQPPGFVWEDFFLAHADLLTQYVERTTAHWPTQWSKGLDAALGNGALLRQLGDSIIAFLEEQNHAWSTLNNPSASSTPVSIVTATPSVKNLHLFFELFPNAAMIIIVRDGPSLIESGVRSFDWDYGEGMRSWARSARCILDFCDNPKHQGRFMLVRFEDLYSRNRDLMSEILDFLRLDSSCYDFDRAASLAVMGSSEVADREGKVHWDAQRKRSDFNPLERASAWGPALKSRFAWIAGRESIQLGYSVERDHARPHWNTALDRLYGLEIKIKSSLPIAAKWVKCLRYRMLRTPLRKHPAYRHKS